MRPTADIIEEVRSKVALTKKYSAPLLKSGDVATEAEATLLAEIDRLRAAMTWRPIETAPEDGTRVLLGAEVKRRDGSKVMVAESRQWSPSSGWLWSYAEDPTHWLPMLGAPEAQP